MILSGGFVEDIARGQCDPGLSSVGGGAPGQKVYRTWRSWPEETKNDPGFLNFWISPLPFASTAFLETGGR